MAAELKITVLGCGSSGGVPRIAGVWGDCDPDNPKNTRRRCSILVQRITGDQVTSVLIDTSPDMRAQLLDTGTAALDGVVYTHPHADHVHGIDDLRQIVYNMRRILPVWADDKTAAELANRFSYVFRQPAGSSYPPICALNIIDGPVRIDGPAGPVTLTPFKVNHGGIDALGFRIADFAYTPDVVELYEGSHDALRGLECWLVDALQRNPHSSHAHLDKTLSWIDSFKPARAVLTNMHIDMDYDTLCAELPAHIRPAFDGMNLTFALKDT